MFIIISKLDKSENENYYQYIWRIGQYVQSGEFSWKEITPYINEQLFDDDESKYRDESSYRKPVAYAKNFYEAGAFTTDEEYVKQMNEVTQNIFKEKQKLSDERTALNRVLRQQARSDANFEYLEKLIMENGKTTLPHYDVPKISSDKDLVVMISDIHYGVDVDNTFGKYNSTICADRFVKLLNKIKILQELNQCEKVHVLLLGDNISGNIHVTTKLENRENVIEQIKGVSELLSGFVYELSKLFKFTYVNSVPGNHSRIGLKDEVLRGERLDDLIPWYMKAKLSSFNNIRFTEFMNYDDTIAGVRVRGHEGLLVHGDFDCANQNGISKLVMMLGFIPDFILFGHLHNNFYQDISNVHVIRGGSFMGTVDDYTISKRITGRPSQMCFTVNDEGIESLYPIILS